MDDIFGKLANIINEQPNQPLAEIVDESDFTEAFDEDMIVPDIRPHRPDSDKKIICVVDDDFSTIDLMKIYLQRDYECVTFDDPKNAVFYLNRTVPDLIFIDSYLGVVPTKTFISIVRTYEEMKDIPLVYICDASEEGVLRSRMPKDMAGYITRPIARGDLQSILDRIFAEKEASKEL